MTFTLEIDGKTVTFTRAPASRKRGGRWEPEVPYFNYIPRPDRAAPTAAQESST